MRRKIVGCHPDIELVSISAKLCTRETSRDQERLNDKLVFSYV